jgi:hypothetical protein
MKKYYFLCFLLFLLFLFIFSFLNFVSNKYSLEKITYNAVQDIQNRANVSDTVAVMDVSLSTGNLNMQVLMWLENHLLNTGKYKIISRQRINTIIKEINFGLTGYVSDETAQSIGKLLGAQYILVFELKNVNSKSYLNIQMLETETATLIYSNSFRINNSEVNNNGSKQKSLRF